MQISEIHLCADVAGYNFSQCDYEASFVTRVRKNEALFGVDGVSLNCHRVATLAFSKHKALLSCASCCKIAVYQMFYQTTRDLKQPVEPLEVSS